MKKYLLTPFILSFSFFTLKAQIINTVAGNYSLGTGYSGNGGKAIAAQLNYPVDVVFDKKGNLYIADRGNS